jgi:plasmid stabilization system protein ParE
MSFRIVLEKQADAEIEDSYRWMTQEISPEKATLWYFDIIERIQTLQNNPRRCPLAPENDLFPDEVRQLLFQQYRILFTIQDEEVHVLRVWHGRRDYAKPDVEE